MELTVYTHTKYDILRRCIEVFVKTYFHKQYSQITFRHESTQTIINQNDRNLSECMKNSFQSLKQFHDSLKLKEKHDVWLIYLDSFVFDSNKSASIIFLNNNVKNYKAICHLFKGELECINEKKHDLEKSKLLNENLKKTFKKDGNFIRY